MGEGSFNDRIGGQDDNINQCQTKNNQQQMLILDSTFVFNSFWFATKQCELEAFQI